MAFAFVQENLTTAFINANTASVSPTTANITTGNRAILVVLLNYNAGGGSMTIGGTNGLTWALEASANEPTDQSTLYIYSAPIITGGGTKPSFTATYSTTAFSVDIAYFEYSGLATPNGTITDRTATNSSPTNNAAPTSGTTSATTAANELVLACWSDPTGAATSVSATGYTQRATSLNTAQQDMWVGEKSSSTSGTTQSATFTVSPGQPFVTAVAVFKLATAVSPTANHPTTVRQAVNRTAVF